MQSFHVAEWCSCNDIWGEGVQKQNRRVTEILDVSFCYATVSAFDVSIIQSLWIYEGFMSINMTNIKQYFLVIKIFDLDALLVIMN